MNGIKWTLVDYSSRWLNNWLIESNERGADWVKETSAHWIKSNHVTDEIDSTSHWPTSTFNSFNLKLIMKIKLKKIEFNQLSWCNMNINYVNSIWILILLMEY